MSLPWPAATEAAAPGAAPGVCTAVSASNRHQTRVGAMGERHGCIVKTTALETRITPACTRRKRKGLSGVGVRVGEGQCSKEDGQGRVMVQLLAEGTGCHSNRSSLSPTHPSPDSTWWLMVTVPCASCARNDTTQCAPQLQRQQCHHPHHWLTRAMLQTPTQHPGTCTHRESRCPDGP